MASRIPVLVAYDIREDARRRRVVKILMGYEFRIQYSVFFGYVGEKDLVMLGAALQRVIDEEDSVLIMPLCERCIESVRPLGSQCAPDADPSARII